MGKFEDAVIYATNKHNGASRKVTGIPAILHSMEVAHIISTITNDVDVMIAGLLHDVVEDTDGTLEDIHNQFGDRVAKLVDSETENKYTGIDKTLSWKVRKEESINKLRLLNDRDVEILWLADKLSNIRSLARSYSEQGEQLWNSFHQKDPQMHLWYYKTIAEILEMHLNRTGAFKEYIKHINFIWPGTFESGKSRYKKYREVSLESCQLIGKGAKGDVYRYDDELVLKLYNENNQYKDIERENSLARQAFIAGIPTAISFGIVKVGNRYGSLFELLDTNTVSAMIAANPSKVEEYAVIMADIARTIHSTDASTMVIPSYMPEVYSWISGGIAHVDEQLTEKVTKLIDTIAGNNSVIHGDFHTGNVISHRSEFMLIDMDRLSRCHPIIELCGLYMFYVAFGELDKSFVENFMGFSYETSLQFFDCFMKAYLRTDENDKIESIIDKAALLCYVRLVRRCYKKGLTLSDSDAKAKDYYIAKLTKLLNRVENLDF